MFLKTIVQKAQPCLKISAIMIMICFIDGKHLEIPQSSFRFRMRTG